MNPDVLRSKLETVIRCTHRIESKIPKDVDEFKVDIDIQDIVMLNLERVVQTCVDIGSHILADYDKSPGSMADVFRILAEEDLISIELSKALSSSVGFRNISVHQYRSVDMDIVYSIITKHLDDFRLFGRYVEKIIG